jgi:hypothetical protein
VALAAWSPSEAAELLIAAPSACAIGDELSFRAERALGQPLEAAAPVRCTIYIARRGAAYAARFEVEAIGSPQIRASTSLDGTSAAFPRAPR